MGHASPTKQRLRRSGLKRKPRLPGLSDAASAPGGLPYCRCACCRSKFGGAMNPACLLMAACRNVFTCSCGNCWMTVAAAVRPKVCLAPKPTYPLGESHASQAPRTHLVSVQDALVEARLYAKLRFRSKRSTTARSAVLGRPTADVRACSSQTSDAFNL